MSYDSALTIFSPDGHIFQVEYAMEAVERGTTTVGIVGENCVVIGIEKKSIPQLQDAFMAQKITLVDENIMVSFSGMCADGRILTNHARTFCCDYLLRSGELASPKFVAEQISSIQQRFTRKGGARPYGASLLIGGIDFDKKPHLFLTDPAGSNAEWIAATIGKNSKIVQEYLEKNIKKPLNREEAIQMTVNSLLEVIQSGAGSMMVSILDSNNNYTELTIEELQKYISMKSSASIITNNNQ